MDGLLGFGGRSQSWPAEHGGVLRVWLALGIGSALVADGLLRLLV
jgi:hypothetical protein